MFRLLPAAVLLLVCLGCGEKSKAPLGRSSATTALSAESEEVGVEELTREFKAEIAANAKWRGKTLLVKGGSVSASKLTPEGPLVIVSGVECLFASAEEAGTLTVSDEVWVRGECKGLVNGQIRLAGCHLVEPDTNLTFKWSLRPGELKWYVEGVEPPNQRRLKLSMETAPKDANVMLAVIFAEDLNEAKAAMKKGEEPPKYLRLHPGGGPVKFEPVILAKGKQFAVILRNGMDEKAELTVKINAKPLPALGCDFREVP
jgi:hypothetical protein